MRRRLLTPAECDRIKKLVETHGPKAAARIAHVAESTITCLKRRDFKPTTLGRKPPPMPADLAIQANHMTVDQMLRHYHVGRDTMRSWLRSIDRAYVPKRESTRRRPAPSREEILAALKTHGGVLGACKHFQCGREVFRRWRRERGIPVAPPLSEAPKRRAAQRDAKAFGWADRYLPGAGT